MRSTPVSRGKFAPFVTDPCVDFARAKKRCELITTMYFAHLHMKTVGEKSLNFGYLRNATTWNNDLSTSVGSSVKAVREGHDERKSCWQRLISIVRVNP